MKLYGKTDKCPKCGTHRQKWWSSKYKEKIKCKVVETKCYHCSYIITERPMDEVNQPKITDVKVVVSPFIPKWTIMVGPDMHGWFTKFDEVLISKKEWKIWNT